MMKLPLDRELFTKSLDDSSYVLNVQGKGITNVEVIDDDRVKTIRRIKAPFNLLTNLKNMVNQFPLLRHLDAYCCQINNIDDLNHGGNRLEVINLQQNGISRIPFAFQSFTKLNRLRLDRNKLSVIENLSKCASLSNLNLSYNSIDSIEGIQGLQRLEVLILRNNCIKSVKSLILLPSLKELDISFNELTNLDGVQNLPVLEILRAESNQVNSLVLSTMFSSHSKALIDNKTSVINENRTSKDKRHIKSDNSIQSANTQLSDGKTKPPVTVISGLTNLNELRLGSNKLSSLKGIESYGNIIEVLDLSDNLLDDDTIILNSLNSLISESQESLSCGVNKSFSKLTEIKVNGNPFLKDSPTDILHRLVSKLLPQCPQLRIVNERLIQFHPYSDSNLKDGTSDISDPLTNRNFTFVYNHFHTWSDDKISDLEESFEGNASKNMNATRESVNDGQLDSDAGDDDKDDILDDAMDQYYHGKLAPKLHLKNMKSIDEICDKENSFRELIKHCRNSLLSISQTDGFSLPQPAVRNARNQDMRSLKAIETSVLGTKKMAMSATDELSSPMSDMVPKLETPRLVTVLTEGLQSINSSSTICSVASLVTDTTKRLEDPAVQLLMDRQLFSKVTSSRRPSNSFKRPNEFSSKSESVSHEIRSTVQTIDDGNRNDMCLGSPKFSIGFDVRLKKF